ncbi:hypothetical protein MD484_g9113, partial [Candolleomyces efflorescens]
MINQLRGLIHLYVPISIPFPILIIFPIPFILIFLVVRVFALYRHLNTPLPTPLSSLIELLHKRIRVGVVDFFVHPQYILRYGLCAPIFDAQVKFVFHDLSEEATAYANARDVHTSVS